MADAAPSARAAAAGRVILVTGATDGIGLALARRYAAGGAQLLLLGRKPPEALDDPLFREHTYLAVDLARDDAAAQLSGALDGHGVAQLDLIVHNAGLGGYGPVERQSARDLDDLLRVNLYAPLALSRTLLPRLRRGGRLVFVGSVAADLPTPDYAAYAASKAALAGLARALRAEGLPVQLVHPGATATGMHAKSGVPAGRLDVDAMPSAARVAARLERAIASRRAVVTLGRGNALLRWAGRHLPGWMDRAALRWARRTPRPADPHPGAGARLGSDDDGSDG